MADKYYRLVCFVVDICADILRHYFVKLAENDAGSKYTTVDSYLALKRHDVIQLLNRKKIRKDQYDLLYPGHGTADENKWDVTLLVTLITELFATCLKPVELFSMKTEIRGIRNDLQHYPNTASMSDGDFNAFWGRLDAAIMSVANNAVDPSGVTSLQHKINDAKCNNLPNIGDCLRSWYEESRKLYDERIDQLESKLGAVESNTKVTNETLRKVTVQKPGPLGSIKLMESKGNKNKRIKVADNILAILQARFESTMNELSNDFNAPKEITDIRTKLRECHHVVVTGSYNSRYLETALAAISGMSYNNKRCVEMSESADWRHIDPEDVDLVVCIAPFGSFYYDERKANAMADKFDSMMHSTRGADGGKTLDIIIVTDLKILEECKMHNDHDLLEEVVKVFTDTSLTHPADLTFGCNIQTHCTTPSLVSLSRNLGVMTRNFLKAYQISSSQVNSDILRKTKHELKASKAIVITGHKNCGKTSIAVALASNYEPSHCLILTRPSDFQKVDFLDTCLIIIDEFAGKYRYEENNVYKWYTMFDHVYNAVIAGQMNVIITCDKNKLDRCIKEIGRHAILDHVIEVPTQMNVIKQEVVDNDIEQVQNPIQLEGEQSCLKRGLQTHTGYSDANRSMSLDLPLRSVTKCIQRIFNTKNDERDVKVRGGCILPSGEIILTDCLHSNLKKFDSRYKMLSVCDLPFTPDDICYIGDNVAVVSASYVYKLNFC